MTITVRPAHFLDRQDVLALYDLGNSQQQDAAQIYKMGTREDFVGHFDAGNILVAVTDEPIGVIGMLCLAAVGPLQIIGHIIVRPDFQGEGAGQGLIEAAKITATGRGGKALSVIDRTPNRDSKLYRNAGFRPIGELMELWL